MAQSSGPPVALVVDDEPLVRKALARVCRSAGLEVAEAGDGEQALAYLEQSTPPRLILLDLTMPRMHGWDFRRRQLANPRWAGIPVVVISASNLGPEAIWLEAAHLPKPFNTAELHALLTQLA